MTPEEYYRDLNEKRETHWKQIFAMIERGKHPTPQELAMIVFEFGLESASDAARYTAMRIDGQIKPPHASTRRPRKPIPDDAWLRWFYERELEDLQMLRKVDRKKYLELYKGTPPSLAARTNVAKRFKVGEETVRKAKRVVVK